jgi:XapX domain-containing protein
MVRLGFVTASLLAVLLTYTALYWASLAIIPKPLIVYWASVNTTGFKPILNMPMLIIYLTSPFNAYEALILHYPPWLYFIATVVMPTVILALILMPVPRLCREGMADCVTVGRSFLTHSFALAIVTSYITSLVTWLAWGKPGIGTSIYTVFMLASAAYVALYLTATLLRRPRHLRRLPTRLVIMILSLLVIVVVGIAYSIYKFLPPTPPHLIGLILTVTTLTGYHVIKRKAMTR